MAKTASAEIRRAILKHVPTDGSTIGNGKLREVISEALGATIDEAVYEAVRDALIADGVLAKGRGRGGSVRLVEATADAPPLVLESLEVSAAEKAKKPKQAHMPLTGRKSGEPSKTKKARTGDETIIAYRHNDHRTNNPEVGLVTPDDDPGQPKSRWEYDPHIDPALQFDIGRSQIEALIDDALASGDDATMRAALEQLKRQTAPYLNWTGKAERTSFEVDTVSLHVHERIDPATILGVIQKRIKRDLGEHAGTVDMFRAWFEEPLPLREAVDFYKHDRGWSNRLVAGDSLLVMNSLLQKESMAGQMQMIYIDPPYGIKYGSNFQPFVNKRDVKDRKDEDLTQEPEMIKAFRDTWELGIHSYLTYLRDRLLLARELLHESGSVFVQISDENLHLVSSLLAEIFGSENHCATVIFQKTTGAGSPSGGTTLPPVTTDFLVWFAKDRSRVKYNPLFTMKNHGEEGATQYDFIILPSGERRRASKTEIDSPPAGAMFFSHGDMTSQSSGETTIFPIQVNGIEFSPRKGGWKTNQTGITRLARSNRLFVVGNSLRFMRGLDDFPCNVITDLWTDTVISGFGDAKVYAVQTSSRVIERCLLMTTDPGDLVLDPTCGSGTTAYVAEKWGRRWITCDTSRVAVTLAKQRLMTASYDYYELKHPQEGLRGGFIYKTVPHVTLKSIVNNPEIDELWNRMHPAIEQALAKLNAALNLAGAPFKVTEGDRKGQSLDFAKNDKFREWEVPFDYPTTWKPSAREAFDAFHAARQAMQKKMDDSIASHADQETLYDQPAVSKDKLRITGPFTVEAVPFPTVTALDDADQPQLEADSSIARSGESARQHQWRDELLKTGIRGKGGQILKFASLEALPSAEGFRHLNCTGNLAESGDRVVVSFGPEYAALEQRQVELAIREAGDLFPRPKVVVFCAFAFDPEAAKDIDAIRGITALKAQMNTDLLTEDLKKNRASNQSFWLMGQPEVTVSALKDGKYQVEVHGFDYFDTKSGELKSGGKGKIAAWMLDTDYDERSLFPRQVFFPMAGKKDGWNKLKKSIRAELDERLLEKLHNTKSLPFEPGENRKVAVKIIDDRGIESLKILPLDD